MLEHVSPQMLAQVGIFTIGVASALNLAFGISALKRGKNLSSSARVGLLASAAICCGLAMYAGMLALASSAR